MSAKETLKRYVFFSVGLFINAFGVSFITKASLGTSPISSIPYVLSLSFKPTMGMFTFLFNILLIIGEILLLQKNFKKVQLLQIPMTIAFSYFIDLTMSLLHVLNPNIYVMKLLFLLIGCAILALGVTIEVLADVIMLPGEAFVKALSTTIKKDFGTIKVCFDTTLMVAACILSLILFHHLEGVREGTVCSALIVGFIVKFYHKKLGFIRDLLVDTEPDKAKQEDIKNDRIIITISRQYGSGGQEIGKKLAEKLEIAFYNKEIIELTAKDSGYTNEFVEKNDQKLTNSLLYDLVASNYAYSLNDLPPLEAIFVSQSRVIKEIAAKESCVIVGRCADYILRENENCLNFFIGAGMDQRIERIMDIYHFSAEKAKREIAKNDKERANHYKRFTGQTWGNVKNYNLAIDTEIFGIDGAVKIIEEAIKQKV